MVRPQQSPQKTQAHVIHVLTVKVLGPVQNEAAASASGVVESKTEMADAPIVTVTEIDVTATQRETETETAMEVEANVAKTAADAAVPNRDTKARALGPRGPAVVVTSTLTKAAVAAAA